VGAAGGGFSPAILIFLFAAVVIAVIVIGALQAAKRRQAWQALAQRYGCSFSAAAPFAIDECYPQSLFDKGDRRKAYNVLSGKIENQDVMAFDYQYTERRGSGKNRHSTIYHFTCLLLTPPIPFQRLWIRPESFLDRVGEFFGLDDIDFESDEFSRRFFVKCPDKKFAYDILHARAMELLLECGKIFIEAQDDSILFYYSGSLRVPEDVGLLIQRGLRFLELIPSYLIEQKWERRDATRNV
jgi:hypothetical protein